MNPAGASCFAPSAGRFFPTIRYAPPSIAVMRRRIAVQVTRFAFIRFTSDSLTVCLRGWAELVHYRRLAVLDHPDRRLRLEVAAAWRLHELVGRPVVGPHLPDVHGRVLAFLERRDDHVERVVCVRHHVRGELDSGILLFESRAEADVAEIAVRVPDALEEIRLG